MKKQNKGMGWVLVALILVVGAWLRLADLDYPEDYYFDEVYHVPTAKLMALGDGRAYEWWHSELTWERQTGAYIDWLHPPLAKLFQATSIVIFGDNPWGWRLASSVAGILLLLVVYLLARTMWPDNQMVAIIAILLGAVDGLAIAQSRIAMNDIFVTLFMTAAVLCYYSYQKNKTSAKWLILLALMTGGAIASKWSGVFLFLFFILWQKGKGIKLLIFLASSSMLIYFLSYSQLFLTHPLSHFFELHRQIWLYQTNLEATHPFSSKAWEWPLGLKPVYLYVSEDGKIQLWNRPFYLTWYLSLVGLVVAIGKVIFSKMLREQRRKYAFLILAYFCFWAVWLWSPRIMFFYHYLPAVPMLWLITGGVMGEVIKDFFSKRGAIIRQGKKARSSKRIERIR
jgi:dolichyl-phosphate-mannose--protein O-mannosyl transferase